MRSPRGDPDVTLTDFHSDGGNLSFVNPLDRDSDVDSNDQNHSRPSSSVATQGNDGTSKRKKVLSKQSTKNEQPVPELEGHWSSWLVSKKQGALRATESQMRQITEKTGMVQQGDMVDSQGRAKVSDPRGRLLVSTFHHLFAHLREHRDDTADTYGLWLVDHSESEEEEDSSEGAGVVTYNKRMHDTLRHIKSWKAAIREVDPMQMARDDVLLELKERGLSRRGDKQVSYFAHVLQLIEFLSPSLIVVSTVRSDSWQLWMQKLHRCETHSRWSTIGYLTQSI